MSRSKKMFAILSVVFLVLLFYASYDIGRRTTFPGSKPQLKERLKRHFFGKDSIVKDSFKAAQRQNLHFIRK
jgi:hypothetical protein